jgi:hypothetical protein
MVKRPQLHSGLVGLLATLGLASGAWAAGTIDTVLGDARIADSNGVVRVARAGERVNAGETVLTGLDGQLLITTDDSGVWAVRPRTRLQVVSFRANAQADDRVELQLSRGAVRVLGGWVAQAGGASFRIATPHAQAVLSSAERAADQEIAHLEAHAAEPNQAGSWLRNRAGAAQLNNGGGNFDVAADTVAQAMSSERAAARAVPPSSLFAARASDARVDALRLDAQTHLRKRMELRRAQVANVGGVEDGAPRVSTQCTEGSPAMRSFDELLRALEVGDVALFQRRLNPAMPGYGLFINDIMVGKNLQRQTRVEVFDKRMQCSGKLVALHFAWRKFFLTSTGFQPVRQEGRASVLLTASEPPTGWQLSAVSGDNLFANTGSATDGVLSVASASVSLAALPSGCSVAPVVPVSGVATATLNSSVVSGQLAGSTCLLTTPNVAYSCSISAPGAFGAVPATGTPANLGPVSCTAGGSSPAPIGVSFNLTGNGSAPFTGTPGATITINVPVTPAANTSVLVPGMSPGFPGVSVPLNGSAPPVTCSVTQTLPGSVPAPVCTGAISAVPLTVQVNDADLSAASISVQVTASNGDVENWTLPRIAQGVYRINQISVRKGAPSAVSGNGAIDVLPASVTSPAAPVTLTLRYTDATTSTGTTAQRLATLVLLP